jgi:hypothetical protein
MGTGRQNQDRTEWAETPEGDNLEMCSEWGTKIGRAGAVEEVVELSGARLCLSPSPISEGLISEDFPFGPEGPAGNAREPLAVIPGLPTQIP